MTPSLDIIVVNWNAGLQLRDCLQSIVSADRSGFTIGRVVIVDNASTDESLDGLESMRLPLAVIRNPDNRGFGAAFNQGLIGSQADYVLNLSPDARLFSDSLARTIEFMEAPENKRVGICGVQLLDSTGNPAKHCARFPKPSHFLSKTLGLEKIMPGLFESYFMSEWDHRDSRIVDHVMGAVIVVRRSLFETLGGFDEHFFLYLEDLDFSLRARQAGWLSYFLTGTQAYHKGGGTTEQVKVKRLFYSLRSRILYSYKHFSWFGTTAVTLATLFVEPVSRTLLALSRGSLAQARDTLMAYAMLWRSLAQDLANRRCG